MILMNFLDNPILLIPYLAAVIIALTVHEFAHALCAFLLGDNTARDAGRLTLNPLAHLSLAGSLFLLFVGFGWGKPVPFNQYNLKFPRFGPAIVAVAGPLTNLILAIILGIVLRLMGVVTILDESNLLVFFLFSSIILNICLMIFNLLPIPPLDGSKVLFSFLSGDKYYGLRHLLETQGSFFLIVLLILDNFSSIHVFSSFFSVIINFVYHIFF